MAEMNPDYTVNAYQWGYYRINKWSYSRIIKSVPENACLFNNLCPCVPITQELAFLRIVWPWFRPKFPNLDRTYLILDQNLARGIEDLPIFGVRIAIFNPGSHLIFEGK